MQPIDQLIPGVHPPGWYTCRSRETRRQVARLWTGRDLRTSDKARWHFAEGMHHSFEPLIPMSQLRLVPPERQRLIRRVVDCVKRLFTRKETNGTK